MFFEGWFPLGRIVIVGTLAYLTLVLVLRATGKRTLSKLNAFDLIVTVSIGSSLSTVLLSKDVSLSEGVTALALLTGLQWIITWSSVRSPAIASLVKAEPTLLFLEGRFLHQAMKRERVTEAEVRAAVRGNGVGDMGEILAVVLETDGDLHVIGSGTHATATSLADVRAAPASSRKSDAT